MTNTYRFHVNMSMSDVIEVEADSYDEAFELAHVEANEYSVLVPGRFTAQFDDVHVTDA
jgi:hypothetical protein